MKKSVLLKKIAVIENKRIQDLLRQVTSGRYRHTEWYAVRHMDDMLKSGLAVHYAPRLGIFKDFHGKLTFNPETMLGHSYGWYEITKKIGNRFILNTYNYSRQTWDHVCALKQLFNQLGIQYQTIEAPTGLQNLDRALKHSVSRWAENQVKNKYRRGEKWDLDASITASFKTLAKLGYKPTKEMRKIALKYAETSRSRRLERLAVRRKANRLPVIDDFNNERLNERGLHLYNYWGTATRSDRLFAVRQGYDKIFLHRNKPVTPRPIQGPDLTLASIYEE